MSKTRQETDRRAVFWSQGKAPAKLSFAKAASGNPAMKPFISSLGSQSNQPSVNEKKKQRGRGVFSLLYRRQGSMRTARILLQFNRGLSFYPNVTSCMGTKAPYAAFSPAQSWLLLRSPRRKSAHTGPYALRPSPWTAGRWWQAL